MCGASVVRCGNRFASDLGADERGYDFVRLPVRPRPVAESERPGELSTVLTPLNLEGAGLRVEEDPNAVPAIR
ncbi:MAG: hypothetical protein OXI33_01515 [Chloroflexota bacterium]|nr:hypothetical protein [Chloroflexota bacterium]